VKSQDWDAANPGILDWRKRPGLGIPELQSLGTSLNNLLHVISVLLLFEL